MDLAIFRIQDRERQPIGRIPKRCEPPLIFGFSESIVDATTNHVEVRLNGTGNGALAKLIGRSPATVGGTPEDVGRVVHPGDEFQIPLGGYISMMGQDQCRFAVLPMAESNGRKHARSNSPESEKHTQPSTQGASQQEQTAKRPKLGSDEAAPPPPATTTTSKPSNSNDSLSETTFPLQSQSNSQQQSEEGESRNLLSQPPPPDQPPPGYAPTFWPTQFGFVNVPNFGYMMVPPPMAYGGFPVPQASMPAFSQFPQQRPTTEDQTLTPLPALRLLITPEEIKALSTPENYNAGEICYFDFRRKTNEVFLGTTLQAIIDGRVATVQCEPGEICLSSSKSVSTDFEFDPLLAIGHEARERSGCVLPLRIRRVTCTCGRSYPLCEHLVALLLKAVHSPDSIPTYAAAKQLFNKLSKESLVTLLLNYTSAGVTRGTPFPPGAGLLSSLTALGLHQADAHVSELFYDPTPSLVVKSGSAGVIEQESVAQQKAPAIISPETEQLPRQDEHVLVPPTATGAGSGSEKQEKKQQPSGRLKELVDLGVFAGTVDQYLGAYLQAKSPDYPEYTIAADEDGEGSGNSSGEEKMRCGYCNKPDHVRSKCPKRLAELIASGSHDPLEFKHVAETVSQLLDMAKSLSQAIDHDTAFLALQAITTSMIQPLSDQPVVTAPLPPPPPPTGNALAGSSFSPFWSTMVPAGGQPPTANAQNTGLLKQKEKQQSESENESNGSEEENEEAEGEQSSDGESDDESKRKKKENSAKENRKICAPKAEFWNLLGQVAHGWMTVLQEGPPSTKLRTHVCSFFTNALAVLRDLQATSQRSWRSSSPAIERFSSCLVFCEHGWDDPHLVRVLRGEFAAPPTERSDGLSPIAVTGDHETMGGDLWSSDFCEDARVLVMRLSYLAEQKRWSEHFNLSLFYGLSWHTARALIALGRPGDILKLAVADLAGVPPVGGSSAKESDRGGVSMKDAKACSDRHKMRVRFASEELFELSLRMKEISLENNALAFALALCALQCRGSPYTPATKELRPPQDELMRARTRQSGEGAMSKLTRVEKSACELALLEGDDFRCSEEWLQVLRKLIHVCTLDLMVEIALGGQSGDAVGTVSKVSPLSQQCAEACIHAWRALDPNSSGEKKGPEEHAAVEPPQIAQCAQWVAHDVPSDAQRLLLVPLLAWAVQSTAQNVSQVLSISSAFLEKGFLCHAVDVCARAFTLLNETQPRVGPSEYKKVSDHLTEIALTERSPRPARESATRILLTHCPQKEILFHSSELFFGAGMHKPSFRMLCLAFLLPDARKSGGEVTKVARGEILRRVLDCAPSLGGEPLVNVELTIEEELAKINAQTTDPSSLIEAAGLSAPLISPALAVKMCMRAIEAAAAQKMATAITEACTPLLKLVLSAQSMDSRIVSLALDCVATHCTSPSDLYQTAQAILSKPTLGSAGGSAEQSSAAATAARMLFSALKICITSLQQQQQSRRHTFDPFRPSLQPVTPYKEGTPSIFEMSDAYFEATASDPNAALSITQDEMFQNRDLLFAACVSLLSRGHVTQALQLAASALRKAPLTGQASNEVILTFLYNACQLCPNPPLRASMAQEIYTMHPCMQTLALWFEVMGKESASGSQDLIEVARKSVDPNETVAMLLCLGHSEEALAKSVDFSQLTNLIKIIEHISRAPASLPCSGVQALHPLSSRILSAIPDDATPLDQFPIARAVLRVEGGATILVKLADERARASASRNPVRYMILQGHLEAARNIFERANEPEHVWESLFSHVLSQPADRPNCVQMLRDSPVLNAPYRPSTDPVSVRSFAHPPPFAHRPQLEAAKKAFLEHAKQGTTPLPVTSILSPSDVAPSQGPPPLPAVVQTQAQQQRTAPERPDVIDLTNTM